MLKARLRREWAVQHRRRPRTTNGELPVCSWRYERGALTLAASAAPGWSFVRFA